MSRLGDDFQRLSTHIEEALKYAGNSHNLGDVYSEILSGKAQFWPGKNSVIITEIITYPAFKSVRFWLAGGRMSELLKMEKQVVEWARGVNCTVCEIMGRPGWEKVLKDYKKTSVLLHKEI